MKRLTSDEVAAGSREIMLIHQELLEDRIGSDELRQFRRHGNMPPTGCVETTRLPDEFGRMYVGGHEQNNEGERLTLLDLAVTPDNEPCMLAVLGSTIEWVRGWKCEVGGSFSRGGTSLKLFEARILGFKEGNVVFWLRTQLRPALFEKEAPPLGRIIVGEEIVYSGDIVSPTLIRTSV